MQYLREDKFLKAFGHHLRKLRQEKKLSQEKLANLAGIEDRQLRRIENGAINTGISTIYVLARALDVPVTKLFEFEF